MNRAVVIPCRVVRQHLSRALDAVAEERVFVVDDTDEGALSAVQLGEGVSVVPGVGGGGFATAANLGLAAAESEGFTHVLVLNDDAQPEPGCLDALSEAWTSTAGAVAPLLIGQDGVESAGIRVTRWGRVSQSLEVPAGGRPVSVDAVSGACILIRAEARFDEGYRHGMEDISLCRALRRAGKDVMLVPTVRCRHLGGATLNRRSPLAQRYAVSGHLRLVGGGLRTPVVLALAAGQVLREGADRRRLAAIRAGWQDWRLQRSTERSD